MRFSRAEVLLFWGAQNLVDEKHNVEVFFVVCYKKFSTAALLQYILQYLYTARNHPQGKVVWIIRAIVIFECRIINWPSFGRRPRFASNACSSLNSNHVYFESCVMCIR